MNDDMDTRDRIDDEAAAAQEAATQEAAVQGEGDGRRRKGQRRNERSQRAQQALKGVWQGRILSLELFRRNFLYIIVIVGMLLMYIGNKFECQSKMEQVMALKKELDNAKTDCVNASARYNSKIRESQMKALVDTMHIDLTAPDQPPYHLSKK